MLLLLAGLTMAAGASDFEDYLDAKYQYPDPAVATTLSASIGFGAGHFYARRPAAGMTHFMFQAGGLTMVGYGTYQMLDALTDIRIESPVTQTTTTPYNGTYGTGTSFTDPGYDVYIPESLEYDYEINTDQMKRGATMLTIGLTTYIVDHIVDTATAPSSAKRRARNLRKRGKR
jgi:hypothetical protein